MTGRRRLLILLLAVVLVLGTGVAAALFLHRHIERDIDGGGSVTVELPWSAGTPAVRSLPAVDAAELPLATLPLTRPVGVEAGKFLPRAGLTFSYAGLELPAGTDPDEDVTVFTRVPDLDVWVPVDTTVDAEAATATISTPHFSEWVLGVTTRRAARPAGPRRAPGAFRGRCARPDRLRGAGRARLQPGAASAAGRDPRRRRPRPQGLPGAPGGRHLPVGLRQYQRYAAGPDVPPGFVRHDAFIRATNQVFADALAVRHPGTAVVMDGEAITVTFADTDVTPDTRITGQTDWGVYLLSVVRLVGAALLMGEKDQDKAAAVMDDVLLAGKLWDCLDKGSDEIREADGAGDVVRAGLSVIESARVKRPTPSPPWCASSAAGSSDR